METQPSTPVRLPHTPRVAYRLTDTYGLVMALIVLDYLLVSTLTTRTPAGSPCGSRIGEQSMSNQAGS